MPIYVILFNIIFRRERPKGLDIAAVALTFVGIAVFFIDSMGAGTMLGNVLALGAGLCFAVVFFVSSDKDATPIEINYIGNLMYIFLIPFLFVDRQLVFTPASVASILFLGIVQLGIAYIFFSKGIQNTSAISASLISAVEPILNPVWAMIIIGEKPSLLSVLAGIFVVIVIAAYNIIKAKTEQNEMQKGNV
jgi:drug/metabolite transporter (DMT)-like permease